MMRVGPATAGGRVGRLVLAVAVAAVAGVLVAGLALPLVGSAGVLAKTASQDFENLPSVLRQPLLPQQTRVFASDGTLLATIYSQNRVVVPLRAISPLLQHAIVAIEDERFYEHKGVDLRGLARAVVSDAKGGTVQGGSTLTQQYVKNVLLLTASTDAQRAAATERTPARKLREMRLALGLEQVWTKQQILEGYLNIAYFGSGAYGAEAASERYFGVHASQLTLPQAATLAGIVQSPVSYDPRRNPQLSQKRRDVVLGKMLEQNYVTQAQYDKAVATPMARTLHPKLPPNGCTTSIAPFFCSYVIHIIKTDPTFGKSAAERLAFLDRGGYDIRTTLDVKAQLAAQHRLVQQVPMTDRHGAAVSVVQPGTGNILVMAQNRLWGTQKGNKYTTYNYNVDRASDGVGFQTGSTFKPFVLAAALEQRIPVNERIHAPSAVEYTGFANCKGQNVSVPGAFAHNEEGHAGTYDLRTGLWASVNTFFVKLEQQTGICRPAQVAAAMGVRRADGRPLQQVPSMTLGTNEIAPLDMAEAYASFAAHGLHCDSRAIVSITDVETHKKVKVPPARCGQVLDPKIADGVTAILHGVIDGSYSGRTGAREAIGRPAAGKTGTTDGHVNVWFIGFVPQLAAAVWVGAPTGSSNVSIWSNNSVTIGGHHYSPAFGNNLPGPVWKDVMSFMTRDLPVKDFAPVDPSVVRGFTIQVPQVAGLSPADALRRLQQAGFQAQLSPNGKPSKFPVGTVAYTSPVGGSSVGSGTLVTVYLSTGPPKPPSPTATPTTTLGPSPSPTVHPSG